MKILAKIFLALVFSSLLPSQAFSASKAVSKKVEAKKTTQAKQKKTEQKKEKAPQKKTEQSQLSQHISANTEFYFLTDIDTKEVLLARGADTRIAPSSMTKLMTAYVVFSEVNKGKINLSNQCLIGRDAWRKSGSSMFLNYGDVVSIEELVKGLLVVSGNDAAVALAETVGHGKENFVAMMNEQARKMGLKNSHFQNPHGLNDDGHYMSLRDLATLITHLYEDFPQYWHFFGIDEFTYRGITQKNRNPLIQKNYDAGTLGGKTGYTGDGGYGVVALVKRDDRRLVAVVNKAKTRGQRANMITRLFDYGFDYYKKISLFKKGETVAALDVWLGKKDLIEVVTKDDISFNMPREKPLSAMKVRLQYKSPVYAPIEVDAQIATLVVEIVGYKNFEYPLYAKEAVGQVGTFTKIQRVMRYKIKNFLNKFF